MKFKVHFSIKRENLIEDGSRIVEAETPDEAVEYVRERQHVPTGSTLIIRKVKVKK